jgi:predicted ATPase
LKDLTRPERIFQISAPGLPADFPPLRALDSAAHNLPVQLTSFIGREREMEEARRLLASTRLLTLTGPGGTGKTRLSLQVAGEVLPQFADGAWLVELAPLADAALVPAAVAAVWAVREQPGRPLAEVLVDYLRTKSLLLILDNCEHVIEACAQLVTRLLSACPKLKILPSSREALGVAGETTYRVPSLAVPDDQCASPQNLLQFDAARLFVERAQAAQPRFAPTAANLPVIIQICQRLDGIPLTGLLGCGRVAYPSDPPRAVLIARLIS